MVTPIESQKRLLYFIRAYGEVTVGQVREFARKCELYFGPGLDLLDILIADCELGKISVDYQKGLVRSL